MEVTVDVNIVFSQVKSILRSPKQFFSKCVNEKGWKKAFVFVLIVAAFGHLITLLYGILFYPKINTSISESLNIPAASFSAGRFIVLVVASYFLTLGMSFVWGVGLKFWLSLFKVKSTFTQAYRIMTYSRTPNYIFSSLPIISILAAFYSFYLLIIGLENEYSLTRKKTILIVVTAIIPFFIFSLFILSRIS